MILTEVNFLNRFIYTGSVDVTSDISQDLLRAADQYLLEGLKRLCEYTIAQVSICTGWFAVFWVIALLNLKGSISRFFFFIYFFNFYFHSQDISLENVSSMYELSEAFHAISLRHACILFILGQFDKLNGRPG